MKDEMLGILFDMDDKFMISTDNVNTTIKEDPKQISWAVCPVTYTVYIKQKNLIL